MDLDAIEQIPVSSSLRDIFLTAMLIVNHVVAILETCQKKVKFFHSLDKT